MCRDTTGISGVGNSFQAQGMGRASSVQAKLGETLRIIQHTTPTVSPERFPAHGMASALGSRHRFISKASLQRRLGPFAKATTRATTRPGRTETMTKIWNERLKEARKSFWKKRNKAKDYAARGHGPLARGLLRKAEEEFSKVIQGARAYLRTPVFKSSGTTAGATTRATASPASPGEIIKIWGGRLEKAHESFSEKVAKAKDYAARGHGPLARDFLRKAEEEFSNAIQSVRAYMGTPDFEGLEESTRLPFQQQTMDAENFMQTAMKEVKVEIEVRKRHR